MKPEFKVISDLINRNSHVLDVGCGDGMLMELLAKEKNVNIRGIEISKIKVQNCIAKGLTIIEGNAEEDLKQFPDKSFDYVVLSQTLQAFLKPEKVIDVDIKTTNVSCFGSSDGIVEVYASGGKAPYSINWLSRTNNNS